jgi:NADH:ubiquinone oxidoreductase subunit 4 (subunit M)
MSNIALPGTSSFVGEFLLLIGIFQENFTAAVFSSISVVLGGAYSLWLYNRIVFGNLKTQYLKEYKDINLNEFFILLLLWIPSFFLGLLPVKFLNKLHISVVKLFVVANAIVL